MKKVLLITFAIFLSGPQFLFSYPGEIIKSFVSPGSVPTGMTFDGKNLWIADRKAKKIFCIDPKNGEVIRSIPSPGYWPMGLTWDGEALWNSDVKGGIALSENYDGKIYRIDPNDGTILKTVPAPTSTPRGLAWDGKYLWCVDNRIDEIIQFSPDDGTTIRSFKAPASECRGLTFDGKYLWVSDRIQDEIYMVDPDNSNVIIITDAPGPYTRGLCYDGETLWANDYDHRKIYQLKVKDNDKFRRTKEHKSIVTFNHQTHNYGPGKVKTLDVHLAIPENRHNQDITAEIKYIPAYTDVVTDKWGMKTAHYSFENIEMNENKNIEMITEVTTYNVRYFVFPDKVGNINEIPGDVKDLYLADNEKYQINHPLIQSTVKRVLGDEKNAYQIARKLFNYLIDNMYYEMVGGWNTAPAVLERGNGSCSEYSFVYIALCRAAGLPARYVGSVVIRGDYTSMDDVFHRWVEVYLPGYGWIPIDPSGGDQNWPHRQADYIGFVANRFLITTQSGGGSETMEWTYNSNQFWTTEPQTNVVFDHFAEWRPAEK